MLMFLLLCAIPSMEASMGMMIHQGVRMSCNNAKSSNQTTWKKCVIQCVATADCVVAQTYSGSPLKCYMCSITDLSFIQRSANPKDLIALKTSTLSEKDCGTFQNGSFTGKFNNTSNLSRYQYTTVLSKNGLSWSFTYNISKICPANWKYFNRILGGWCIQVSSGYVKRPEALAKCQQSGATLTGLETAEESTYIYNMATSLISDSAAIIWIDGVRRPGCQLTSTPKVFPVGCGLITGFDFMDKYLLEKKGFTWEINNPDGLYDSATNTYQDCLNLWIRPNNNQIDDVLCSSGPVHGYACGKPAG